MSTFPSVLTSYTDPAPTNRLNSPSHSSIESAQNSGLSQLEAIIGVAGASSVVGSYEYWVKSPASNGGGHVQTANKGGTGQTSYNKGDILVATSSSVLSKLAVGLDGQALVANSSVATGIQWGGFPAPTVRVYSTPSILTWTKPAGLSYIIVETQGGGGNGANGTDSGSSGHGGGGGAGGGYARKVLRASVLGATETINVASALGYSSFGTGASSVIGLAGTSGSSGAGGDGGPASGGDINIFGSDGASGVYESTAASEGGQGGQGGNAYLGGGGKGGATSADTGAGGNLYGGGGGGGGGSGNTSSDGGAGAQGIVIVTEY